MRIGIAEEQEGEEKENLPMNGGTLAGTAMGASDCDRVVSALSQTKKGQLKYDTKWKEEGRTEEIVNTVEEDLFSINSRPLNGINGVRNVNGLNGNGVGQQSVSFGYQNNSSNNNHHDHQQLNSTVKPEIQNDTGDHVSGEAATRNRFKTQPQHQQHQLPSSSLVKDENEELIKQYELERSEKVQERVEETAALLRANYDALLEKMDSEMRLITNNFILMKLQTQRAYEEEYANLLQSMMAQEQNLLAGQKTGTTTSSSEGPHPATSSKLKELQERQKLLERQKELRLQQQTEYRERVTRAKEAISRTLADCEAARLQAEQQQQQQPLQLDASVAEQLQHCRTLLLAAISELEVMLLTTASSSSSSSSSQLSELTAEHLKVAAEKQQQATAVGQRYLALLTRQQQPQSSTVIQSASEGAGAAAAARKAQPPTSTTSAQAAQLAAPRSAASTGSSSSTQPKQQPPSTSSSSSSTANSNVPEFSHPAELIYERSQLELIRFEQVVDRFIGAEENKKRRTSLQISIRTRINTMCNEAVSKLADKTRKLLDLLSGQRVESKGEMLQCTPADGSLHFAINTAVMAFLNVAIKQKNMALRLAPVVSVLWSRLDPLFGRVFLAQLYRVCPYAVPYYPVQEEEGGLSAEEFMVRCGYQLNAQSGAISETDEAFQERIYSLVQLYAAVLQCNVTEANGGRGNSGNPIVHPRDLQFAWHWLARVLNGRPQAVMTALMLDAFLAVSAHKLLAAYGRQFEKVLRLIRRTTVPAMEAVTPKGEQQTLMKFKSLLEGFERKVARLAGQQQQQRGGGGGGSRLQQSVARSLLPEDMELVPDAFFRI